MNLETSVEQPEVAPRDAASIIVLRQQPQGFEVLLMRRHGNSKVLGGAYVFPGGKVDPDDAQVGAAHLAQSPEALCAALAEDGGNAEQAVTLFSAAIRETLEECGVLFMAGATAEAAQQVRETLLAGTAWSAWVAAQEQPLQSAALVPWSRWITPKASLMMSKRFDTRFFVAALPSDQCAQQDGHEATALEWWAPQEALARYDRGEIDMAPPQIMTLLELSRFDDVAQVLAHGQSRRPPLIQPHHFAQDGVRVLAFPGDPTHEVSQAAWPGATRIYHREGRFGDAQGSVLAMLQV